MFVLAPLRSPSRLLAAATLAGVTAWSTPALAQNPAPAPVPAPPPAKDPKVEAPKGTVGGQAAASAGATTLDEGGKIATAAAKADDVTHATELELSAGGLFNSGNARSLALTAGGRFRIRRKIHEFSVGLAGNYGRASLTDPDGTSASRPTAGNVQGRLRYDVFFHPRVSFFTMGTVRHDPFLGLAARMRLDPGFAFFAVQEAKHRLWAEVGYDFQYDVRRVYDVRQECERGGVLIQCYALAVQNVPVQQSALIADNRLAVHSMRLFAGYVNQLSEIVTFTTGLEYIQGLSPLKSSDVDPPTPDDPVVPRTRLWVNWDAAITVQVRKNLGFATTFTLRHDNAPLPGVRRLDTITAVSLTYRFF
jgi:putative salt-induced outer membrane protein YdiY